MRNYAGRKIQVAVLTAACMLGNLSAGFAASLSLEEAVGMALDNNYKVKIAEKGEEKAQVKLQGAKRAKGPAVTVSTSLGVSDIDDRGFSRNNNNSIRLSLPLYTGGRNEMNVAKAEGSLASSGLETARTRENLVLETVTAYYDILAAQKVAEVDAQTVRNYEAHLAHVKGMYTAGSAPKVDLLRSEVELANARQNLIKSQNAYDVAVSALRNIIRMDASEDLQLTEPFSYAVFSRGLDECIAYAKACRKDLLQAKIAVEQAQKDVEIAKSDKRPSVSLSVGNGWDKQLLPAGDNHSLTASVAASWNVFDNNVTNANIDAAEIAVEEAQLALLKAVDEVDLEVRQSYLNMREAEKRFHTTEVAVQQAEEDYYIASEKYKAGEGVMLDIIDAQLALSTAKTNYIKSRYDYASNKAKLENAMGLSEGAGR